MGGGLWQQCGNESWAGMLKWEEVSSGNRTGAGVGAGQDSGSGSRAVVGMGMRAGQECGNGTDAGVWKSERDMCLGVVWGAG